MARGQRKDIDGSESVPCFYGKELRFQRERAALTLEQLVEGSFYGATYLSEIERGQRRMPVDLARHVDRVLKTDGYFERCCDDVRRARLRGHAEYFERILEAEKRAETIEQWAPAVIPGLLQAEPYMRALFHGEHVQSPEEIEARVQGRLARAKLLQGGGKDPEYWVILHETVLRMPVLPPRRMAEQLRHILDLTVNHRVIAQVVPWRAGAHPLMLSNAMVLTFADAPPLVYTESQHHGLTVDDPALVKQYQKSYDVLRAVALSPEASLALIEEAAEDYRNDKQTAWVDRRPVA
ncbi:helix-turn-helix transcriptional regulator [Streptomyces sp. TRM76323]|uniref:Helix-turn-helix transcriptional regulator n=1 Tax=Streptomyces tamarix TaxID=3078565 RepID=A0ABU3QNS3_9ACTN|nr:helix-turn-helix transcriptional regulator [Streptomyces tamarix]MDT9684266.1 helix-turn-helix transcriptional regulator [Streptomyces tamarix]